MKNIPKNIWRTKLTDEDWNFARCPSNELVGCLSWELCRERVQSEANGTFPLNPLKFKPSDDDLLRARFWSGREHPNPELRKRDHQIANVPEGWIPHPDFPQLSYLELRNKERWKRKEEHGLSNSLWLDVSWNDLYRHAWDEVEAAAIRIPTPTIWRNESEEVVPMRIPWNWRDDDIVAAFRDWLKERRPKGEDWDERPRMDEPPQKPKDKGGRGSVIPQLKFKLKALSAWRLIQYYNGNNFDAYEHPDAAKCLGRQFGMPGAWSEARKTVHELLKEAQLSPKYLSGTPKK